MGQMAVPLIISAVSTGVGAYNQHRALKAQDRIAARGIEQQARRQKEADTRLNQQLNELERSDPEAERQASQDQFMAQLRRNRSQAAASMPSVSGASDRYVSDVASREGVSRDRAARLAELMSRIDAPMIQRRGERESAARAGTDLGQIGRFAEGEDFLSRLRISRIQPNPWVQGLSQLGQSYGAAAAGRVGDAASREQLRRLMAGGMPVSSVTG